jgi:hypothetical protein
MKQLFLKKFYKFELEFFLWWNGLEEDKREDYKAILGLILFIISFLLGAYFDAQTLEKIKF